MANLSSYPQVDYTNELKLLANDPSRSEAVRVSGQSLFDYMEANFGQPAASMLAFETTAVAVNEDLAIGNIIYTAGNLAPDDGSGGPYLVVAAGEGDIPMFNGNELLSLPFGSLAGSDATNALVTDYTGTDTVADALNKRTLYVATVAELKALAVPVGTNVYLMQELKAGEFIIKSGTPPADPLEGIHIVLNSGNYAQRLYSGPINVTWFGASSAQLDNAQYFQAANDYSKTLGQRQKDIFVPAGDYVFTTTLFLDDVLLIGENARLNGSRLFHQLTSTGPMISCRSATAFSRVSFIGRGASSLSADTMVEAKSDISFNEVDFLSVNYGVSYLGSDPIFYNSYSNCTFINCKKSFIYLANTSAAGVDLIMEHCRFLGDFGERALDFELGLGSIIADNLQLSCTGAPPTEETVRFGTPAELYGAAQFTNCVFESNSNLSTIGNVEIYGTALRPWKEMQFTNCSMAGNVGISLGIAWCAGASFVNCGIASSSNDAIIKFSDGANATRLSFDSCRYESLGTGPVFLGANNTVSLSITNPHWSGANPFANFLSTPSGSLELSIFGGEIGTSATPIILLDAPNTKTNISVFGYNSGPTNKRIIKGTLDAGGSLSPAHGIFECPKKIISAVAYYKGGTGEAIPLTVTSVNNTNIFLTGGAASAKYRATITYNTSNDTAW